MAILAMTMAERGSKVTKTDTSDPRSGAGSSNADNTAARRQLPAKVVTSQPIGRGGGLLALVLLLEAE